MIVRNLVLIVGLILLFSESTSADFTIEITVDGKLQSIKKEEIYTEIRCLEGLERYINEKYIKGNDLSLEIDRYSCKREGVLLLNRDKQQILSIVNEMCFQLEFTDPIIFETSDFRQNCKRFENLTSSYGTLYWIYYNFIDLTKQIWIFISILFDCFWQLLVITYDWFFQVLAKLGEIAMLFGQLLVLLLKGLVVGVIIAFITLMIRKFICLLNRRVR